MIRLREHIFLLKFPYHFFGIVAPKGPSIQSVSAVTTREPLGFFLVVASIGRCRETKEKRLFGSLPARQAQLRRTPRY